MPQFSRRKFLSGATAASITATLGTGFQGMTALTNPQLHAAEAAERKPLPRVKIGKTGIETTLLGVGTGTFGGTSFLNMGQEKFVDLMLYAFENGIRYIDTAENYRVHIFMRFALQEAAKRGIKREDFYLLTKSFARTAGAAKVIVDRYLYEMECQYIDTLLMHCLTNGDWPTANREVFDVLLEEKKKGRIKSVGVSMHSYEALEACLEVEELDVVLVRINPFGINMDDTPEKVVA
ncbi:MAG: aldo/keto reductase, partial [Thermoguttaceae bacterium]